MNLSIFHLINLKLAGRGVMSLKESWVLKSEMKAVVVVVVVVLYNIV